MTTFFKINRVILLGKMCSDFVKFTYAPFCYRRFQTNAIAFVLFERVLICMLLVVVAVAAKLLRFGGVGSKQ